MSNIKMNSISDLKNEIKKSNTFLGIVICYMFGVVELGEYECFDASGVSFFPDGLISAIRDVHCELMKKLFEEFNIEMTFSNVKTIERMVGHFAKVVKYMNTEKLLEVVSENKCLLKLLKSDEVLKKVC